MSKGIGRSALDIWYSKWNLRFCSTVQSALVRYRLFLFGIKVCAGRGRSLRAFAPLQNQCFWKIDRGRDTNFVGFFRSFFSFIQPLRQVLLLWFFIIRTGGNKVEVYIDILFLVNGACCCFLLWIAGKWCGIPCAFCRMMLGGFGSSLLYCMLLWMGYGWHNGWIWSLLLSAVGIYLAFMPKRWKRFFSLWAASIGAAWILGGFLTALFAKTQIQRLFGNGLTVSIERMPWQWLLWGCLFFYAILKGGARWLERHGRKRHLYCSVTLVYQGKSCEVSGFLDTGNQLCDADGTAIPVAECAACLPLFSKECALCLLSGEALPLADAQRFSEVAYSALGTVSGRLMTVKLDRMIIWQGERQSVREQAVIGLYNDIFSGGYEILVPPVLLEEE